MVQDGTGHSVKKKSNLTKDVQYFSWHKILLSKIKEVLNKRGDGACSCNVRLKVFIKFVHIGLPRFNTILINPRQ